MLRLRPHVSVLLVLAAACTTRQVRPAEVAALGTGTDDVQALVRLALTLDAAGDRAADTLYTPDAVVVGNARVRLATPRFAGITSRGNGRVTITAANANVTAGGKLAWVLLDYRWTNPAERRVEIGRATVICERRESGWKIAHAHSSQPLPWEP